jgi:hypothetical protein
MRVTRLFRSRLFRFIVKGLKIHPRRTLRHIWIVNPFVFKTWAMFSLRVNGKIFLRDFTEACGEADVKPFLIWGTLLGCVREGKFLRHDYDIDFGILPQDWPKRSCLIEAMHRRGYSLELHENYKIRFSRDRLSHLDVDLFFPWEGKMVCLHGRDGAWFPFDAFDNFRGLTFENTRVLIPDPPERVLETAYGSWRIPVKKHDNAHIPNRLHIADGATWPKLLDHRS